MTVQATQAPSEAAFGIFMWQRDYALKTLEAYKTEVEGRVFPAFGQEGSTVGMFRLETDGSTASRVPVKLGRSSVNFIEVLSGLNEGDRVVLSDMSAWDAYDRVRLR